MKCNEMQCLACAWLEDKVELRVFDFCILINFAINNYLRERNQVFGFSKVLNTLATNVEVTLLSFSIYSTNMHSMENILKENPVSSVLSWNQHYLRISKYISRKFKKILSRKISYQYYISVEIVSKQ